MATNGEGPFWNNNYNVWLSTDSVTSTSTGNLYSTVGTVTIIGNVIIPSGSTLIIKGNLLIEGTVSTGEYIQVDQPITSELDSYSLDGLLNEIENMEIRHNDTEGCQKYDIDGELLDEKE